MAGAAGMADNPCEKMHAHNGDGLRTSQTVGGTTSNYTWDVGAALPVILQETAGGQTAYYIYGLDLIASIQGTTPTHYLTDGLGSTTELADNSGDVIGTYEYDAFGAVRTHTGVSTEWTFTGEQNDPAGLEYLRARYYDPAIGRFLSRDPFAGLVAAPQSLNRYAYVLNNPALYRDPYGYWGLGDVWDKAKDVGGAIGCGIKAGAEATAQVADWARDQVVSAGAWLASCDWRKVAGGVAMVGGGAVAVGLGGYVIIAAGAAMPAVLGVGTIEAWEGGIAGGAIATGGAGAMLASAVPFSQAHCGESEARKVVTPSLTSGGVSKE
jgi:RHS repeat-associated protein